MIAIRRARPLDAVSIGAVHVAAWRSAYPGILPDAYLAKLSITRQAAYYDRAIRNGMGVHVAIAGAAGGDNADGAATRIVGFATGGRAREGASGHLGEGEIETLYVLDDFRDQGVGRRLMTAAASHLADIGCRSAYCWVLRDNPSRWFYRRIGGRQAAETTIQVGGAPVVQTAFVWDPIEQLTLSSGQLA
jgi:ribosomal protein S18 acetylase RimI-like enzyme